MHSMRKGSSGWARRVCEEEPSRGSGEASWLRRCDLDSGRGPSLTAERRRWHAARLGGRNRGGWWNQAGREAAGAGVLSSCRAPGGRGSSSVDGRGGIDLALLVEAELA